MPTTDELRTELIRSRGFIKGAQTQLTKTLDLLDALMVEGEPTTEPEPDPEPTPEPDPEPTPDPEPDPSPDLGEYHEPAGFKMLRVHDGSAGPLPGWKEFDTGPAKADIVREPDSPSGFAYERTYPANLTGGAGTQFIETVGGGWFPSHVDEIYFRFRAKWLNWTLHPAASKIVYFGTPSNPFAMYAALGGSGQLQVRLQDRAGPRVANRNFVPLLSGKPAADNRASPTSGQANVRLGDTDNLIEIYCVANKGAANGEIHFWLNGVKIGEFVGDGSNPDYFFFDDDRFRSVQFNSIWGGRTTPGNDEMFLRIYDIYVSGPAS